jgi:hypothetical protein
LGEKVGTWMGSMMGKLATKTWDFAADKAWSYLLAGINAYYQVGTGDVNHQSA